MAASFAKDPAHVTKEEAQRIADFANDMSGRGKIIDNARDNTQLLGMVLWATRLYASRINLISGRSFWESLVKKEPKIAKGIAIEYGRTALGLLAMYSAAAAYKAATGDDSKTVEIDPRSTDFGKAQIDNHYVDLSAGTAPYVTLLAQEISGQRKTGKGDIVPIRKATDRPKGYDPTSWDLVSNFIRNRLHPILSAFWSAKLGEDPGGNKATPASAVGDAATPITMSQFFENLSKGDNIGEATFWTIMDAMGYGASNRNKPQQQQKSN